MKVRNKKNGKNSLAYKVEGITKSEIIPADSIVNLSDLKDFNQVVNKKDFILGWFEFIQEDVQENILEDTQVEMFTDSLLEKAKKEAEKYSEEKPKKRKNSKNK